MRIVLSAAVLLASLAAPAAAEEQQPATDERDRMRIELDVRYRYEWVDDAAFADEARASTVRTRLGFTSPTLLAFYAKLELEDVRPAGEEDYNSTSNGRTMFPVVADPDDTELNQAFLGWKPRHGRIEARLGRQRIMRDNKRFIGNVGWRQNEQTYDGLSVDIDPLDGLEVYVAHLTQGNRIFGDHHPDPLLAEFDLDAWLLEADYETCVGAIGVFAHWLELEDRPLASHRNVGLRFRGQRKLGDDRPTLQYRIEVAEQTDHADGAATIDSGYLHGRLGVDLPAGIGFAVGYELLEGDGVYGFATPLATLHAFNGWTDRFLATPASGLEDLYAVVTSKPGKWKLGANYHRFATDTGGADHGDEIGLSVGRPFGKAWQLLIKAAEYEADAFSNDVRKVWVQLGFKP